MQNDNELSLEQRLRQFGYNHPQYADMVQPSAPEQETRPEPHRPPEQQFSTTRALAFLRSEEPKFSS